MTHPEAARLLAILAQGMDPVTGEILPPDHPCREDSIVQALSVAVDALGGEPADMDDRWVRRNGKLNAGRPWTEEDNAKLRELVASGMQPGEIALRLQRRPRGLARQMHLLGLDGSVPARTGQSWTQADDDLLSQLHLMWSEEQLAEHFQRTPYAIHCRLIRLGLIPNDQD